MKTIIYLKLFIVTIVSSFAAEYPIATSASIPTSKVKVGETVTIRVKAKNITDRKQLMPDNVKQLKSKHWIINGGGVSFSRNKDGICSFRYNVSSTPPVFKWFSAGQEKSYLISWVASKEHVGKGYLLINPPVGFQPIKPIAISVTKK